MLPKTHKQLFLGSNLFLILFENSLEVLLETWIRWRNSLCCSVAVTVCMRMACKNYIVFIHSESKGLGVCGEEGCGTRTCLSGFWKVSILVSFVFNSKIRRKFEVRKPEIHLRKHSVTQNNCGSVNRLSNTMPSGAGPLQPRHETDQSTVLRQMKLIILDWRG